MLRDRQEMDTVDQSTDTNICLLCKDPLKLVSLLIHSLFSLEGTFESGIV